MYDNLKSEISEFKLKAAERADRTDKADYYRKTLENERQSREQADKQVLDLLHDVRNRYDTKLSSYMAKNKGNSDDAKQNHGASGSAGSSNNNNSSNAGNKKSKKNKGSPKDHDDSGNKDTWNTGTSKGNDDNVDWGESNDQNTGWRDDNDHDNSNDQDDNTKTDDWNDDNATGWGTEPAPNIQDSWDSKKSNETTDPANKKSKNAPSSNTTNNSSNNTNSNKANAGNKKNKKNKGGSKDAEESGNKDSWLTSSNSSPPKTSKDTSCWNNNDQDNGWGVTENQTTSNDQANTNRTDDDWNNDNATSWGDEQAAPGKQDDRTSQNQIQKSKGDGQRHSETKKDSKDSKPGTPKDSPSKRSESRKGGDDNKKPSVKISTDQDETGGKEYLEIKSQLWSVKLDLRLAERDKSKLREELDCVRAERDDLIRKLKHINAEQDTLKVRLRGVTVDLVSANDEIHKLNERLDEIEADKRSKERDLTLDETRRRAMESKTKSFQQQIANLQSDVTSLKEIREDLEKQVMTLTRRNERLENDLDHSKKLIRTLKDGCAMVEGQAKTFEVRHDTVMMSKADMERELIAIKEESSRHITTINKLQKSNEQISKAFLMSVEAHEQCKDELEKLSREYARRQQALEVENLRVVEANNQLRKLIDFLQKR